MNELQKELLVFYKKIKKILDENSIPFIGIGGTSVGAFREKGFIEWDDDIDIMIPEEHFRQGLKILNKNGISTKSEYLDFNPYPFEKAFNKDVDISSFGEKDHLYIDIFPGYKKREWSRLAWKMFRTRDNLLYIKSKKRKNWIKGSDGKFVYFGLLFAKFLISWMPTKMLLKKQESFFSKHKTIGEKNYRYIYFLEDWLPLNIKEVIFLPFEDTFMPVNKTFGQDMKSRFGDIMIKPDSNKIKNHNIYMLKKDKEI